MSSLKRLAPLVALAALGLPLAALAQTTAPTAEDYRNDARSIEALIAANYAYLDRFPSGQAPMTEPLRAEAEAVHDRSTLLRYAERRLALLADAHVVTGSSFSDSWAIVPSYADLWIEPEGDLYRVTAVRDGSPAQTAGVAAGDRLVRIDGVPAAEAVVAYWRDLGLESGGDAGYAVRVLAAGRRDRPRLLTLQRGDGPARDLALPNLYASARPDVGPVTTSRGAGGLTIAFNDSLGDDRTIAAFDAAMAQARPGETVILDLTDTPAAGTRSWPARSWDGSSPRRAPIKCIA